ncbi:MAG: hypothetical protein HY064_06575 [Bacteroidetes bacterium]|nr:hypothetical protein [Bacteroidota bacterium]
MKTKLLFTFLFSITLLSANAARKEKNLEISSFLTYNGEKVSDYSMIVYEEGIPVDTFIVTEENKTFVMLNYDCNYCIRYTKEGFLDRVVLIDTHVPEGESFMKHTFDFEIELVSLKDHGNTIGDLPVAIVEYDTYSNEFLNDRDYFRQVRGKEVKEDK